MVIKSDVCMDKNVKDIKHTRHISIRVHFVSNGENCKMHKIEWCEGILQLSYISTKNVGDHDLSPRMKYIMVILYSWERKIVKNGWNNKGYSMEQELCMTRLYLVDHLTQSVWNFCRILKMSVLEGKNVVLNENIVEVKPCINR